MKKETSDKQFRKLLAKHPEYPSHAYEFIYEALNATLKDLKRDGRQHITCKELAKGFCQYAIEQFGCLAPVVLASWNIFSADDIGNVTFNLIEFGHLGKQDSDLRSDFHNACDCREELNVRPVILYDFSRRQWSTSYIKCPKKIFGKKTKR